MGPMRDLERFQATNDGERASRALRAEDEFLTEVTSDPAPQENSLKMTGAVERYQRVQKQLIELESNMQRSMEDAVAARATNPSRAELLTTIGKAIAEDIKKRQLDKALYEKEIKDAGGDPTEFILQ